MSVGRSVRPRPGVLVAPALIIAPCLMCGPSSSRHHLDFELHYTRYGFPVAYMTCANRLVADLDGLHVSEGVGAPQLEAYCDEPPTRIRRAAHIEEATEP